MQRLQFTAVFSQTVTECDMDGPLSEHAPHHGSRRVRAGNLDGASGGGWRLRPGVKSRCSHAVGSGARHVDRVTLHGSGTMVLSELNGSPELGRGHPGSPVLTDDGEASHAPHRSRIRI